MIGDLDRRIEIYSQTTAVDTFGERVESDVLLYTYWASVTPVSGSEKIEGKKPTATSQIMFTIRYKGGLTEKMTIRWDSQVYQIISIEEVDRRRYLNITGEKKY